MLQGSGDHMIAGIQHSFYGNIQAFRGVCRKGNSLRAFCTEQLCQGHTGIINNSGCTQRTAMDTAAGIAQRAHSFCDGLYNTVRLAHGSRCVIKVDHVITSD